MSHINIDVAVFGGGVVGLWALARLRQEGYQAVLFESQSLGGIQSIASQGIIHGGTKYALTGKLTGSSEAIREMPAIWRSCLDGEGDIDLSSVRILSRHQYLWSTGDLISNLSGFFADKLMQSRIARLPRKDYPELFSPVEFTGQVYHLDEPVLDTKSLMSTLADQVSGACVSYLEGDLKVTNGQSNIFRIGDLEVNAKRIIFSAGAGNASLLGKWNRDLPQMQLRPLHMTMLRGNLPQTYAHCLGATANPRLTITTHPLKDGQVIWYLGGSLAEDGIDRDEGVQIQAAKTEMAALMPWVDVSDIQWATYRVDRAEPRMPSGRRPDSYFVHYQDSVYTLWPTKLAFAPRLADEVLKGLRGDGVQPGEADLPILDYLQQPSLAKQPWEFVQAWN